MRQLKIHLRESWRAFQHRAGVEVFFSGVAAKGLSFLTSVLLVRWLSEADFGLVSFAQSVLWFFIPLMGWGAQHALFRFGAVVQGYRLKTGLFNYALKWGLLLSLLTIALVFLTSPLSTRGLPASAPMVKLLSWQLVSLFLLELVKAYFRILRFNRLYARAEWMYALTLLVFAAVGVWFMGPWGYLLALIAAPLVVWLYFLFIFPPTRPGQVLLPSHERTFWNYGVYVGIGSVASQMLFIADVFLLGYLLGDERMVGGYRAASLIPMSLLFIPLMYISVAAADLAAAFQKRGELKTYLRRYQLLFIPLALVLGFVLISTAEQIMMVVFGEEYRPFTHAFRVLSVAVMGAFILRAPYGNLLGLVGLSRINATVSFAMLALNIALNLVFIPRWGAIGAAYTTAMVMWISGAVSWYFFARYLKRLE